MSLKNLLLKIYRLTLVKKAFYKVNLHLYKISLRGIGILNSEGGEITGEDNLLKNLSETYKIKTVFDVGANDGGYSKTLRESFPNATIYAFEPQPESFKRLSKVSIANNLKIYKLGLGKVEETSKIWDFADDAKLKHTQPTSTLASIYKDVIEQYHGQKSMSFDIKITTLDKFTKQNRILSIDFIKIDTEGNEYNVLLGAKELISGNKIKVIQFEFNEMNVYSKTFFKDFYDLLPNYEFFRLMPDGIIALGPYRPLNYEIFAFQNILAVNKNFTKLIRPFC